MAVSFSEYNKAFKVLTVKNTIIFELDQNAIFLKKQSLKWCNALHKALNLNPKTAIN